MKSFLALSFAFDTVRYWNKLAQRKRGNQMFKTKNVLNLSLAIASFAILPLKAQASDEKVAPPVWICSVNVTAQGKSVSVRTNKSDTSVSVSEVPVASEPAAVTQAPTIPAPTPS